MSDPVDVVFPCVCLCLVLGRVYACTLCLEGCVGEGQGNQISVAAGIGLGMCVFLSRGIAMHVSRCQNPDTWSLLTTTCDVAQVT